VAAVTHQLSAVAKGAIEAMDCDSGTNTRAMGMSVIGWSEV